MRILKWFTEHFRKQTEPVGLPSEPVVKNILCIDGGGMRGIIPIQILSALETKLREKGFEKSLAQSFDMIAGTSTGGLIALSLSCLDDTPLSEIDNMYMTGGKEIFPKSKNPIAPLWNLITDKYSPEGLERILRSWFGDKTMDQAKVPTLLVSYDLSKGKEMLFRSWDEKTYPVCIAGRATSAAPTYFPVLEHEDMMLTDGGVIGNNPSVYAYFEAKKLWPEAQRFNIISISTAGLIHKLEHTESGFLNWADNILPLYGTAQKMNTDYVLSNITDVNYIRIDGQMTKSVKLDDTSPYALNTMKEFGKKMAQDFDSTLDEIASLLCGDSEIPSET